MSIVRDAVTADMGAVTAIYNHAVAHETSTWDHDPMSLDDRMAWFEDRRAAGFPVLVAEVDDEVVGYATYGLFRPKAGWATTMEHSIYLTPGATGAGIGSALMTELLTRARGADVHVLVGAIAAENEGSLRFHERFGFVRHEPLREVGRKFDRWLDLVFVTLRLD